MLYLQFHRYVASTIAHISVVLDILFGHIQLIWIDTSSASCMLQGHAQDTYVGIPYLIAIQDMLGTGHQMLNKARNLDQVLS